MWSDASPVTGTIEFGDDVRPFARATVYVRVEDVSRTDARSTIVAEQVIPDVSFAHSAPTILAFAVTPSVFRQKSRYALRAHVDVDGDGLVGVGDYVTMERYAVPVSGGPVAKPVQVWRVNQ